MGKMRELVLELAVRGQLTKQVSDDLNNESWRELIAKLDSRDSTLIELPFDIPDTWRWATLNDLGHTKPRNNALDNKTVSFVPMALVPAEYSKRLQHERRQWNEIKKGYTHFADGDVVMAKITPCYENGKSAVIEQLTGGIGAGTTELHVFRTTSEVIQRRYVLIYLKSRGFIERGVLRMTGSAGQKRIPHDYFANSPFPLPPPAEQRRIVSKVDELMSLCDRLEAQQQERDIRHAVLARASLARFAEVPTPANLDFLFHKSYTITPADLRRTILSLAVQGKLVPQDPNDEVVEVLIDRVAELRKQLFVGKRTKVVKKVRELDESEFSHDIPSNWTWCRLGDLVLDFRYGTSRKCGRDSRGVPVLRIPNIQSGKIDSTDLKFTDMPSSEYQDLRLREGDLLLIRSNGSENLVGRSAVASADDEQFAYAGYLVRARIPREVIFSHYLYVALSTPMVRSQIEGPIRTTSGVKNINTTELSNLVLPLPPFAEQRRIVTKVDQLMALVDQLETQLTTSRSSAEKLIEAVVAELTSQRIEVAA